MDYKWLCIENCYTNNHRYQKGDIVLAPSSPNTTFFVETSNDDAIFQAPPAKLDHDGTYYYGSIGWDDFRFPLSSTKQGANSKPDYDFTDNGFLFPQNNTAEILYASDQFPHSMYTGPGAQGTPHIHVIQAANQQAVFKLKYRIHQNGGAVSAWTTLTSTGYVFPYSSGSICQIVNFPHISLETAGLSSILDIQLWREDNVYTGDILVKSVDIHIPFDSLGSGQTFSK